jgi:AraC-like DNA-binding protein
MHMTKQVRKSSGSPATAPERRTELAEKIAAHARAAGAFPTEVPGLTLFRRTRPTACNCATYEPSVAVFAQGKKRVNLAGTEYLCGASSFLLASIDIPVQSQILEASEEVPMLSMLLRLEMPIVREILSREELPDAEVSPQTRGLAVGQAPAGLLNACVRLVELLDTPEDIPFVSHLIQREIIYRILRTPQGARLRSIATTGDLGNRTARAIAWLKANYTKRLHMEELAEVARMGVSTLHHQFRALTAMSPLQYQKQLRLQAARDRMFVDGMDASSAAYEVGYESVSQFSREYSRFFGQPPMRDIKSMRAGGGVAATAA